MTHEKPTILFAEEEDFLTQMYTKKFENLGYIMQVAADGKKAFEMLQHDPLPDLLLLDIGLPWQDGFTVLKKIRQDPRTKELPVIILSNLSQKTDINRGMELGANDYIVKLHHTPAGVVNRVKKLLRDRGPTKKSQ